MLKLWKLVACVYRHIRLDKNEPFYIGIGASTKRASEFHKSKRSKFWTRIYSKSDIRVDILFDDISFKEAKIKEIEFIELYGRRDLNKGTLCNLTDGGDGMVGYKASEASKRLTSERMRKNNPAKNGHHPNTLRAVSESGRDTFWITNGVSQKRIKNGNPIPSGYKTGQTRDLSAAMSKGNNPMFRGYWVTPKGVFYSSKAAAKVFGVDKSTIEDRCKGWRNQYYKGKKYIQTLSPEATKGYSFIPITNFTE